MVQVANKFRPPKKKINLILSPAQLSGEDSLPTFLLPITEKANPDVASQFGTITSSLDKKPKPQVYANQGYKLGAFKPQLKSVNSYVSGQTIPNSVPNEEISQVAESSGQMFAGVDSVWDELAEYMHKKGKISISNALRKTPEEREKDIYVLRLDNSSQLEDATPEKQEMVDFLRKKTGIPAFNLILEVVQPHDIEKKLLSPKEKYQKMIELNPLLKALKDKLDLDIEY